MGALALGSTTGVKVSSSIVFDLTSFPEPSRNLIADSQQQFSQIQGDFGWWNGYYSVSFVPNDFRVMEEFIDGAWRVDSTQPAPQYWTGLWSASGHPNGTNTTFGRTNSHHWAVRRWKSWISASARIEVSVKDGNSDSNSNGQRVLAFHNSRIIGEVFVPAVFTSRKFEAYALFKEGDTLDVALDPVNGHDWADALEFVVKIYLVGDDAKAFPNLEIVRSKGGLDVKWPKAANKYTIQRSFNSLSNWSDVTSGITVDSTHLHLLIKPDGRSEFFRLIKVE